ncbi:MAG: hypothetical protein IIA45_12825 [Bacteroidetes bacterium]|nr:hypothetical protein [Bacteroidota bacterium]
MLDIASEVIQAECPSCKNMLEYTLRQISEEAIITCSCGENIQLVDEKKMAEKTIGIDNLLDKNMDHLLQSLAVK